MSQSPFSHRVYLGWITDLASQPDPNVAWPSMRRDQVLVGDYKRALDTIAELGFTALCVWGLAAARDWPLDLSESLSPEKRDFAAQLSAMTRARGLHLLAGTGVYSWGFETIIQAHPHLARTNARAMCPQVLESWDWMRRVLDFIFSELPLDGVQLQSADLGRCECEQCLRSSALEHHAALNQRVAEHIRAQWPGKTIGVNGWGMKFSDAGEVEAALPHLAEMGRYVDYFTGIDNASAQSTPARRMLIESLPCAVGTIGGTQVEPPQHWERERWFLPVAHRTVEHLRALAQDGGRSCEAFFHIEANPGDELSLWARGLALQNPHESSGSILRLALERLYQPRDSPALDTLCELFTRAEGAFFDRARGLPCGTFSLEPLLSSEAGPPIYLNALEPSQRAEYARDLRALAEPLAGLRAQVGQPQKLDSIARCLENAARDAAGEHQGTDGS